MSSSPKALLTDEGGVHMDGSLPDIATDEAPDMDLGMFFLSQARCSRRLAAFCLAFSFAKASRGGTSSESISGLRGVVEVVLRLTVWEIRQIHSRKYT
jgi:hypothetical protein